MPVAQLEGMRGEATAHPDDVLARLRAGDEAAFADLVDRWTPQCSG